MPINQLETNLSAITTTIAHLEKEGSVNEELLNNLKEERDKLLRELNLK
jgi:flagellar hook-associated protein FlgK